MAWIELHQSLASSRKLLRLKEELGVRKAQAAGHVCFLWLWALDNCPDGDLSGLPPKLLAEAADFSPRKAEDFVEALVCAGFLDREGERLRIHHWEEYTGRLNEIRERNAERKRRSRERKRDKSVTVTDESVTVTGLPDPTGPDRTQPDPTGILSDVGGGARADAQQMQEYLQGRGLLPQTCLGVTEEMLARSRALTDELFHSFCTHAPTEADYGMVFPEVCVWEAGRDGQYIRRWDPDRADLLRYAFEQAALQGRGGCWPYIRGVLVRLHQRGIRDLDGAERYEVDRDGL